MKKWLSLLLAALILLGLAACGGASDETAAETTAGTTGAPTMVPTTVPPETVDPVIAAMEELEKQLWSYGNARKALSIALDLADQGVPDGMYYAGKLYLDGEPSYAGVKQDAELGLQYLEQGAALGQTDCMTLLGFASLYGAYGRPLDEEAGLAWMKKGAELGNYACMNNIGNFLIWNRDPAEGLEWLKKALENPDDFSRCHTHLNVGSAYAKLKEYDLAEESFRSAIELGAPDAYRYLGNMFRDDLRDFARAMEVYQEGAEAGEADCLLGIGELYERGQGVQQSRATAREWFQKALDAGSYYAQEALNRVG